METVARRHRRGASDARRGDQGSRARRARSCDPPAESEAARGRFLETSNADVGRGADRAGEGSRSWEGGLRPPAPFRPGVEFRLGRRELGHVHGDTLADLCPSPRRIRDMLADRDRAARETHRHLPDSGLGLEADRGRAEDVGRDAIELFRLSYERARVAQVARSARDSDGASKDFKEFLVGPPHVDVDLPLERDSAPSPDTEVVRAGRCWSAVAAQGNPREYDGSRRGKRRLDRRPGQPSQRSAVPRCRTTAWSSRPTS